MKTTILVRTFSIVVDANALLLRDETGNTVDTAPINRAGARSLSVIAFDRGADQVRHDYHLGLTDV